MIWSVVPFVVVGGGGTRKMMMVNLVVRCSSIRMFFLAVILKIDRRWMEWCGKILVVYHIVPRKVEAEDMMLRL